MPEMMTTAVLPGTDTMNAVLRLADAADAVRPRGPARPTVYCPADDDPRPEGEEEAGLRRYLATLTDDEQARIHAIFWIGRDRAVQATEYARLYHHALTSDLGDAGAAYLSAKGFLGESLRRGLKKLGLEADPYAAGGAVGNMPRR